MTTVLRTVTIHNTFQVNPLDEIWVILFEKVFTLIILQLKYS